MCKDRKYGARYFSPQERSYYILWLASCAEVSQGPGALNFPSLTLTLAAFIPAAQGNIVLQYPQMCSMFHWAWSDDTCINADTNQAQCLPYFSAYQHLLNSTKQSAFLAYDQLCLSYCHVGSFVMTLLMHILECLHNLTSLPNNFKLQMIFIWPLTGDTSLCLFR